MKPPETTIIAIVAYNSNRVIANNGQIPWDIPEDTKHFQQTIADSPVIMGRKTYEDTPPIHTTNIVLTKTGLENPPENVYEAHSLTEAFTLISQLNISEIYNIGGAEIYQLLLPYTDKLIISHIHNSAHGDTKFPTLNTGEWNVIHTNKHKQFTIKTYIRS